MNQMTPVTIYPNADSYTVVTRESTDSGMREVSETFDSYEDMSEHLQGHFGE